MHRSRDHQLVASWVLLRDELVGFVTKRVESREIAEDIVQDVFVRLQQAEPGSIVNPQPWLYRAARNATIDHYRTRRTRHSLDGSEEAYLSDHDPGPNTATRELAMCLQPLVNQLPQKYRRAVTLVDLEGLTHSAAAALEGISESGMKSRVQRGRAKLGGLITRCCAVDTDSRGAITEYEEHAPSCGCSP